MEQPSTETRSAFWLAMIWIRLWWLEDQHTLNLEVQYICSATQLHTPVHTLCSYIRRAILDCLTVVIKSQNYTCNTTPLIGFYCHWPQCAPTPHIAICEGKNPSAMMCISSKKPIGLLSSHHIWFGKVCSLSVSIILLYTYAKYIYFIVCAV